MLPFGKEEITSVGIVSGGAALDIVEAKKLGVDLFITGEPKQSVYHLAQELQINALFAGHYATETFGVQRLGALLQKQFGVAPRFIDIPTGI
jgi:putative NIF3 family GTP cyclohydrolase 1 type 2